VNRSKQLKKHHAWEVFWFFCNLFAFGWADRCLFSLMPSPGISTPKQTSPVSLSSGTKQSMAGHLFVGNLMNQN
jgi:hypothetical protein